MAKFKQANTQTASEEPSKGIDMTHHIKRSLVEPLECCYVRTCSPDYWGGHHMAHITIPVYGPMTMRDIKRALHTELNDGAICGNDERSWDDSGDIGDAWYARAHAAVNRIKPAEGHKGRFFKDIKQDEDADYLVYAYFVFRGV